MDAEEQPEEQQSEGGSSAAALLAGDQKIVGWFRRDETKRLYRALLPAMIPTAIGALVVAWAIATLDQRDPYARYRARPMMVAAVEQPFDQDGRVSTPLERVALAVGLALTASGPFFAIWGLRRVMRREDFLLLRTDAIAYHRGDGVGDSDIWLVTWDEIELVAYDKETDSVDLTLRAGGVVKIADHFADITNEELSAKLREVHRKAIWSMLPQQRA